MVLTGNDIALAQEAASGAIARLRDGPHARTKFVKGRIAEYKGLIERLQAISDAADSTGGDMLIDELPADYGNEVVMVMKAGRRTRGSKRKVSKE